MSQHADATGHSRSAIISELACISGEICELQNRVSRLIRDLSTTTIVSRSPMTPEQIERVKKVMSVKGPMVEIDDLFGLAPERPAPALQAATPAGTSPAAQDEGRTDHGRRVPDEAPVRGAGTGIAGQSGKFVTTSGVGEAVAAAVDPAPAPDEPRVPRRPAQVVTGNGRVQDGGERSRADQVLDLWAETLLSYDEIATKLKINPNAPSVYVSTARAKGDPRAKRGDEPRDKIRYENVMALYAACDATPSQIDRKLGLQSGMTQKIITQAWGNSDERVKQGDARRRPAPPKGEPSKPRSLSASEAVLEPIPIPEGHVIAIDRQHGEIVGPTGSWACAPLVGKALSAIADGHLRGIDRMAAAAGVEPKVITASLHLWQSSLRRIGVDLVHTQHIGCKLNRIAA